MKRLSSILVVATLLGGLAGAVNPAAVAAATVCSQKSAIYTYIDRTETFLFNGPPHFYQVKLTASMCYDGLGNAYLMKGTTPAITRLSGGWAYSPPTPTVVVQAGLAYVKDTAYMMCIADSSGWWMIRIEPRLRISGVNGLWYAYDGGSSAVTGSGQTIPELNPVFVSAVLQ